MPRSPSAATAALKRSDDFRRKRQTGDDPTSIAINQLERGARGIYFGVLAEGPQNCSDVGDGRRSERAL
jgi:hypothetical protein